MSGFPDAVLFDRDGTLVIDVPYNVDADRVQPMPGAVRAVKALRTAGILVGVITNQSVVARGLGTLEGVRAVNRRVDETIGPFDVWAVCPHGPGDGCLCRKPLPGMVLAAAEQLGTRPSACVVIGDSSVDVAAARAAGSRSILVTRTASPGAEVEPDAVAASLSDAATLVLSHPAIVRSADSL